MLLVKSLSLIYSGNYKKGHKNKKTPTNCSRRRGINRFSFSVLAGCPAPLSMVVVHPKGNVMDRFAEHVKYS